MPRGVYERVTKPDRVRRSSRVYSPDTPHRHSDKSADKQYWLVTEYTKRRPNPAKTLGTFRNIGAAFIRARELTQEGTSIWVWDDVKRVVVNPVPFRLAARLD